MCILDETEDPEKPKEISIICKLTHYNMTKHKTLFHKHAWYK